MNDLDTLRAKLRAREGRPGFAVNAAEIRHLIGLHEGAASGARFRDNETGRFVSDEYALANPGRTTMEAINGD